MRFNIGAHQICKATALDVQLFDLISFLPGAPIGALSQLSAQSRTATDRRLQVLAAAGFVEFHQELVRGGYRKVVYPA